MIAIPNMEKPKECKECQWHLDFYIEDEQVGGLCTITEKDDRENTCPLIEIDDDVWENEKYKLIRMTEERRINKKLAEVVTCGECKHSKEWYGDRRLCYVWAEIGAPVFEDGYCSYGERRTDEI